jgi:hypothetical protein
MTLFYDIVRVYTGTAGTDGPLALGAAVPTFRTPDEAGIPDGAQLSYGIEDFAGSGRETGFGIYSATAQTLTRNCTASTNGNAPISLSGQAQIFVTALAVDLVNASNLTNGALGFAVAPAAVRGATAAFCHANFGAL